MKKSKILYAAALLAALAGGSRTMSAQVSADAFDNANAVTTTTVTSVTGTITQLNYGSNGAVEGFLIGPNTLLTFPTNITGGIGTLGAVGNSVAYSGTAATTTAGFQAVRVTSLTNNTTKATYSSTTATPTTTAYGPTTGTVKQVNYDTSGAVDSFLFTAGSSTVLVAIGSNASTTLKPLLTVGASLSVTGTTSTSTLSTACLATGVLQVVEATSLTIGSQTIVLAGGGNGGGRGPGGRR